MKRPRDNQNRGPSRVNRPTVGSSNDNRGKVGEMSEPSAPVTSSSTSFSTTADTRGEDGEMSSEPSSPATSSSTSCSTTADTRGEEGEMSSELSSPATSTSASSATAGAEGAEAGPLLRKNEALAYLQLVKDTLNDDKEKYRDFVELLKCYKKRRIDLPGVITRVKELFKGLPELVLGWFAFLRLRENEALAYLQLDEALVFLRMVKDTFNDDEDKYRDFVELFKNFKERTIDIPGVMTRVLELFKGHPKLVLGWFAMLRLRKHEALAYLQLVKDTFNDDKDKYRDFVELFKNWCERTIDIPGLMTRVKELFKGHPELFLGFNAFLRIFHRAPGR